MTTSADINPAFITSAAVSKEATRNQFQNVKDAVAAVEGRAGALEGYYGWRRLSVQNIVGTTLELRCDLSVAYERYRIDFRGLQCNAAGQLQMRVSNDNTTFASTNYDGVCQDCTATASANFNTGSTIVSLTGTTNNSYPMIVGFVEYDASRLQARFETHWLSNTSVRTMRKGVFGHAMQANYVQFFWNGFAASFNAGTFTVIARP